MKKIITWILAAAMIVTTCQPAIFAEKSYAFSGRQEQTITGVTEYNINVNKNSLQLKFTAKTPLTYQSMDKTLADVDETGRVTFTHRPGTVKIRVYAEETKNYKEAKTWVTVNIATVYKTPSGKIGEATGDERGKTTGGKAGDQTGNEVRKTNYKYSTNVSYRNWKFVIRCTDSRVSKKAADFVNKACANKLIGYNNYANTQSGVNKRNLLYERTAKIGLDVANLTTATDVSCTPLCMTGLSAGGIDMDITLKAKYNGKTNTYLCRTVNAESLKEAVTLINKKYVKNGKDEPLEIITLTSSQWKDYKHYLYKGDIICTGHHTAMVL